MRFLWLCVPWRGQVVLAAALLEPWRPAFVGVELLPSLAAAAAAVAARYAEVASGLSAEHAACAAARPGRVRFECADMLAFDWSGAAVVFCAAVCFPPAFMDRLGGRAAALRRGAAVVVLRAQLAWPGMALAASLEVDMDWGQETAHIYVRE